jgi:hypothetical protein
MLNLIKTLVFTPATPNPVTPPPVTRSLDWELFEAEQLACNKFIALEVRKEVQKQMRSHSRPAKQIWPLEHLPRVKRVKELAFSSFTGASSSKTTLELPARAAVHQLFPSFATEEDRDDHLLATDPEHEGNVAFYPYRDDSPLQNRQQCCVSVGQDDIVSLTVVKSPLYMAICHVPYDPFLDLSARRPSLFLVSVLR